MDLDSRSTCANNSKKSVWSREDGVVEKFSEYYVTRKRHHFISERQEDGEG